MSSCSVRITPVGSSASSRSTTTSSAVIRRSTATGRCRGSRQPRDGSSPPRTSGAFTTATIALPEARTGFSAATGFSGGLIHVTGRVPRRQRPTVPGRARLRFSLTLMSRPSSSAAVGGQDGAARPMFRDASVECPVEAVREPVHRRPLTLEPPEYGELRLAPVAARLLLRPHRQENPITRPNLAPVHREP